MVDRGNKDSHRYTYSGGVKAVETEKWGRDTAAKRYGEPQRPNMRPKDACYPQFKEDQAADKTYGDHRDDWVRGFGQRPNFDYGGKRR